MSLWGSIFAKGGTNAGPISLIDLAAERSRFLLDVIPLRQNMSQAGLAELVGGVMASVTDIENSQDPRAAVRFALCDRIVWLSGYQVMVMEPEPAPDPTGLRAMGGVTGQLKARVYDLFKADPEIEKESMLRPATSYEEAWNVVLLKYWQAKYLTETLNTVRKHIVGAEAESLADWHRPFLHAMCVVSEQRYRTALRLPSALPVEQPETEILRYQAFLEFVTSDVDDPYSSWQHHFNDNPDVFGAMRQVYERFGRPEGF